MKKGVAIPYIIAILLGIAVIGLIGFWLFKSTGIFGTKTVEQDCRSKFLNWCQQWFTSGYLYQWVTKDNTNSFLKKNSQCSPYTSLIDPVTDECTGCTDAASAATYITNTKNKCFVG